MTVLEPILVALIVALAFPPFGLWPLALIGFIFFARALLDSPTRSGPPSKGPSAVRFAVYSFAVNIFGFYWLAYTLKEFANLSWLVAVPAMILVYLGFALIPAAFGALWGWIDYRLPGRFRRVGLTLLLVAYDGFDPRLFPWSPVMSVGSDPILMASVAKFGTWGWRVLFFGLAVYLADLTLRPKNKALYWRMALSVLLVFGSAYGVGFWARSELRKRYADRQPIALVQGNIGNYEKKLTKLKIMPTVHNVLAVHRDLIERAAIHLAPAATAGVEPWVLWPETSFPGAPTADARDRKILEDWTRQTRGLQLVGSYENMVTPFGGKLVPMDYNIIAFFHERTGYVSRYQKNLRLAFGEYIPGDETFPGLYKLFPAVNHFGRGHDLGGLAHPDPAGAVFLPLVCYEILFESFVDNFVREAHAKYPGRPLVLINPSNDSWYGPTSEPFQNAHLARWAAARVGLPLLRPTNTGLSQIVAPWGEVMASGPRDDMALIFGELPVEHQQKRLPATN
ncbi:MAG: apolipoprotein N-acyltransferase [Bdellovibrionales bacterium]|nr:apolipoprotein N-acyltransferase [Bdellovibrionales bacterium]